MFSAAPTETSGSPISYAVARQVTRTLELTDAQTAPMSAPWEQCLRDLQALLDLPEDWDGEGSAPPDPANVKSAIRLLRLAYQSAKFALSPQIVPGGNGEVILAWREGDLYLEAELAVPSQIEWMLSGSDRQTNHWTTDLPDA